MVSVHSSSDSDVVSANRTVFLRSFFLETLWNYPRMQNIGFTYCIFPALRLIHRSDREFREAVSRQLESSNTHPSMAPLFAGLVSRMEKDRPASDLSSFRRRIMTTLAAHGDRFFWGHLKPFAAIVGVIGMLFFPAPLLGPLLALMLYNIPNLYFRIGGFRWGFEEGLGVLEKFRSARVENSLSFMRSMSSLFLGILTGLVLWQCYRDQFGRLGDFYGLVSALDVGLTGITGFVAIKSGFSVTKVTLPIIFGAIFVFGLLRYWIGIP